MLTQTQSDILAFVAGALLGVLGIYALARFTPTVPPAGPNAYRKKPVVIEARQFTGGAASASPLIDWILANGGTARWNEACDEWESEDGTQGHPASPEHLAIRTLEGTMFADPGDWIIRGVKGEFYPVKPDIFAETYEPADATRP